MAGPGVILVDRGQDDRFRSRVPRLLHTAAGWPLWRWSLRAALAGGALRALWVSRSRAALELSASAPVAPNLQAALRIAKNWTGAWLLPADLALVEAPLLRRLRTRAAKNGLAYLIDELGPESVGLFAGGKGWAKKLASLGPTPWAKLKDGAGSVQDDCGCLLRVRDRADLAEAETTLRRRTALKWMRRGVSFRDPESSFIGPEVSLSADVLIEAFTSVEGRSRVARGTVLGPHTRILDSRIDAGAQVQRSIVEGSRVRRNAQVGPWARLRPGTDAGVDSHLGNFCEFKAAKLGRGVKVGHLSYLGDTSVGEQANIGAGTITANFDGRQKHRSRIGKRVFTGSGTVLVAPVELGAGARTGAGAVVLKNQRVKAGSTVVGVPARALRRGAK